MKPYGQKGKLPNSLDELDKRGIDTEATYTSLARILASDNHPKPQPKATFYGTPINVIVTDYGDKDI